MSENLKLEIVALIERESLVLGSNNKVAIKAEVSPATISQMLNKNWALIKPELWLKVGIALGYKPDGWQVVSVTRNYLKINAVLNTCKHERLFMAISNRAGSGKTVTLRDYTKANSLAQVFYIQAREWTKKAFLIELARVIGIEVKATYSIDELGQRIAEFFRERNSLLPLLIIDEADKLKAAALRYIITLYNECEDMMGLCLSGTDNLEKEIKHGARYNRKGYDEIDSRLGRNFIHLDGAVWEDVRAICEANGITDKATAKKIFDECMPVRKLLNEHEVKVVEDLRRVQRVIKREVLKLG